MSKLTTERRKEMPDEEFALPGHRFPIMDESHGRAAVRDAPHALHAGNITAGQERTIDAKVHRKFPGIGIGGK